MRPPPKPNQAPPISVSQLNQQAKALLEGHFLNVLVTGEISNLAKPSSGHWYFTLKDEKAQIRCALFRSKAQRLGQQFENGQQVNVRANLSLYETRGDYQLIVEHMSLAGLGALQQAFDVLKQQLKAKGLFNASLKQPLPLYPQRIGIITSPTGAAIRDVLSVLKRRAAHIEIMIYPTLVQGQEAAPSLAKALAVAQRHNWADTLIIGRGGGSLEDLWAFNDEMLAHSIAYSRIPIISAVGHEVDFTIADFVADLRAPTPSAAAELVIQDQAELLKALQTVQKRYMRAISLRLVTDTHHLKHLRKRLQDPKRTLQEQAQRLDQLELALVKQQQRYLKLFSQPVEQLLTRIQALSPNLWLASSLSELQALYQRLVIAINTVIDQYSGYLYQQVGLLNAMSPLSTLNRGFSLLVDSKNRLISTIDDMSEHNPIYAQLKQGHLKLQVLEKSPENRFDWVNSPNKA